MEKADIFISGGGLAGLIAAIAFGRAGFSVICADPIPPVISRNEDNSDLRTTAFLQPSKAFLDNIGLWSVLEHHAMPLDVMRIIDAGGPETTPEPRQIKDFKASDISEQPFGWNVPNWLSRREISQALEAEPRVQFLPGVASTKLFTRDQEAKISLSNGTQVKARLALGADGRSSEIRNQAGISVSTTRFGQKALAFAVTHPIPHQNVSTEIHRSGGPFTLVPLPDYQGHPSSAVVWMETGPNALDLSNMPTEAFESEMSARSCNYLGPLRLVTRRSLWPIISQLANRLSGQRVALIAEAAHVVPPIGAQGLNMSLGDIDALLTLAKAEPARLGDAEMLDRYHRQRIGDLRLRVAGVSLLNSASQAQAQALRDARALGLNALHSPAPLRKAMMRLGLQTGATYST
ncbi:UbiH/UbiF family hydroxylase [Paracoccaceae bacterium]|nr:UbiH/UbiF family hydroxylase [Paracoccaceae bacterium]